MEHLAAYRRPGFEWLNQNLPCFGADELVHLEDMGREEKVFFALKSESLPGGYCYGKCMPLSLDDPLHNHHGHIDGEMCKFLASEISSPEVYAWFPFVPIYSATLKSLPMREYPSTEFSPYCSVVIAKKYWGQLGDFIHSEVINLSIKDWKAFLWRFFYTLHVWKSKHKFQHNDLHKDNVLIDYPAKVKAECVQIDSQTKVRLPASKFDFCIWDFDTSILYENGGGVPPLLTRNIEAGPRYCTAYEFVPGYDVHTFLVSLCQIAAVPAEIKQFVYSLYPPELIPNEEKETETSQDDKRGEDIASKTKSEESESESEPDQKEFLLRLIDGLVSFNLIDDPFYAPLVEVVTKMLGDGESEKEEDWHYQPDATYLDYRLTGLDEEAQEMLRLKAQEERTSFNSMNSDGLLATHRLCERAWKEYKLPTPTELLVHPFFDQLK